MALRYRGVTISGWFLSVISCAAHFYVLTYQGWGIMSTPLTFGFSQITWEPFGPLTWIFLGDCSRRKVQSCPPPDIRNSGYGSHLEFALWLIQNGRAPHPVCIFCRIPCPVDSFSYFPEVPLIFLQIRVPLAINWGVGVEMNEHKPGKWSVCHSRSHKNMVHLKKLLLFFALVDILCLCEWSDCIPYR